MPVDPFLMHIRAICSSLSTAFSVWSYANDAIRQMENEMVLLRGLMNSGCMFSGFPPSSGSLRSVYITAIVRQLFESIDPSPCPWRAWSHCGDILPNQLQFSRGRELLLYSSWLSLEIGVLLRDSPQKNALVLLPLEPRFHFLTLTLLKKNHPFQLFLFHLATLLPQPENSSFLAKFSFLFSSPSPPISLRAPQSSHLCSSL